MYAHSDTPYKTNKANTKLSTYLKVTLSHNFRFFSLLSFILYCVISFLNIPHLSMLPYNQRSFHFFSTIFVKNYTLFQIVLYQSFDLFYGSLLIVYSVICIVCYFLSIKLICWCKYIWAAWILLDLLELGCRCGLLLQLVVGVQLTFGPSQSAECELTTSNTTNFHNLWHLFLAFGITEILLFSG